MHQEKTAAPDSTAVRVALWRALHAQCDPAPHVLEDEIGLQLLAPEENWRQRPDMDLQATRGYRASIVARARFVEDLLLEKMESGVDQYVILGAGLDTFVQRRPEVACRLRVFEVDQPFTQQWKRKRLIELGFGIPDSLRWVSVNFEEVALWREALTACGFDANQPSVVASTGVSPYLTKQAIASMLRQIALLGPCTLAMTFLLPIDLIDPEERPQHQAVYERARSAGTPFISFFSPPEIIALAQQCGFRNAFQFSTADLTERYFSGRTDGLRPSSGEAFLIAEV